MSKSLLTKNSILNQVIYFRPNVQISGRKKIFLHFLLMNFQGQNEKKCKYYQKYIYLGQSTSKYCSHIIVVHVHANGFL